MAVLIPIKQLSFDLLLAVLLLVLSVLLNQQQLLQRWDNLFYDLESGLVTRPVDKDIVIVAIDDTSLQKVGRWPWSRSVHAELVEQLTAAGVAAIAMDILFMEPDRLHPDTDRKLAAAIRRNGHVVLPVLTHDENNRVVVTKPLPEIAEAAKLSHVNMLFDPQGIARQVALQTRLADGTILPAMAFALSREAGGTSNLAAVPESKVILIAFARATEHFQRISYSDVLQDADVRARLRGKIILVGMTAAGLGSRIATPISKSHHLMPGVEFQANILNTIRSNLFIRPLFWSEYTLLSLVLIVVPVLLYRFCKAGVALLLVLGFSILSVTASYVLLESMLVWYAPLPTLLCLLLSYPLWNWRKVEQLGHSLYKEHESANATLKAIGDAVIATDQHGNIEFMNPAAEKMLGCTLSAAKHRPFSDICKLVERENGESTKNQLVCNGDRHSETCTIKNCQQQEFAVRISCSPLFSENGLPAGAVYALSDLTEIININRKIAFIAAHDSLTGLPNRMLLQDRMGQAINSATRDSLNFAVLFIDLDGFKKINDGMGHACGDMLLQEVARRLQQWVRQSDTISRWGGDEFIILLENMSVPTDAAEVAIKIIECLSRSILINNQEVFITPSIGISLFPEDGLKTDVLLAKADAAMYSIKKNERNNFCFYSQDLEFLAKERLVMENELHHAIQRDEFEIFYQPQVNLESGCLTGAEALIRWRHPEKGLVTPDQFIPLAEETGLILPIGEWIVKTVCQQLKCWREMGLPSIKVAINLSPHQFLQKNLVNTITREIESNGVSTQLIQVEITESMIIQNIERVIHVLDELKSAGISIAVDDFGTGYSSLEYLKRFPIDKLKIDKSFVGSVLNNNDDASIVQAVIALGHNMNMQIIAEGVETQEQVDFLQDRKCDFAQGYFFGKPVTAEDMTGLIEALKKQ